MSRADAITPIITFVSMITLGIVISEFIIENEALQLPIILFSFFVGILLAALEMRAMIHRRKIRETFQRPTLSSEEAKDKLARYVAELFEEDIPFDELEEENKKKLERLEEYSSDTTKKEDQTSS